VNKGKRIELWGCGFVTGLLLGFGIAFISAYFNLKQYYRTAIEIFVIDGLIFIFVGLCSVVYSYFKYVRSP
jgi:hypothetical protein